MDVREAGRRGGKVKVPKGFAKMTKAKRKEAARKGAESRWGKTRVDADGKLAGGFDK